ncbi:MAG TPA: DUF4157 domain-containing protein [Kofleriaceae bacterium]|nr:DUF4157 domain-containing protein [Kofleriaceae bacterium]
MSTFDTSRSTGGSEGAGGDSPKAAADAKVGAALAERGSGAAHESGAVFHNNGASHAAADAVGARAFTAGSDVYFGAGQYDPGSQGGSALIQHELTHVAQARGVSAPEPGNFAVASDDSAAEAGARDGSGSGAASANTIYRDPTPGVTPATTGTGPATGGTSTAPAADPYAEWKASINGYKRADAVTKWGALAPEAKAKFRSEDNAFKFRVMFVMKKDSVKVFKDGGARITDDNNSYTILLADDFPEWLPELRTAGFLTAFLTAEPLTTHVNQAQARKLKTWVDQAADEDEAKDIFHKVYPTLHDSSPATWGTAQAWPLARIKQLFGVLAQYLSAGQASTVTGGFVYVTGAGFGWWNSGSKRVWLPDSADGMGHDMTGGAAAGIARTDAPGGPRGGRQVSPDYVGPDGVAHTGQPAGIGHMVGTILHEVGHGVGDQLDGGRGNAYAENSSSFPGFTKISLNDVANALWVSGTTGSGAEPSVSANAKLDESHAKDFFKTEIANGKGSYSPGWTNNPTRADMAAYCKWRYADVPLQKFWDFFVERGHAKDSSYAWDEEGARIPPGSNWVYGYLARGGMEWTKYKKAAWDQKVSWYSLSSPKEWFAEQYTHFYRTEKTGPNIDPTTLALLKDLDKKEFVPTGGTGGVTITDPNPGAAGTTSAGSGVGNAPAGATAAGAQGQGGAQATGGTRPSRPTPDGPDKPLFFPWS